MLIRDTVGVIEIDAIEEWIGGIHARLRSGGKCFLFFLNRMLSIKGGLMSLATKLKVLLCIISVVGLRAQGNGIIVTASNNPPAVAGSPISISGSAMYSALPHYVAGGLTTITLAGTTATTYTVVGGYYQANMPPLSAGIYTARVCVTDNSVSGCTNLVVTVSPPQSIRVTASNQPPNYAGSPIVITGSARYTSPDGPATNAVTTVTLAGTNTVTNTLNNGIYYVQAGSLIAGTYSAQVCVTDGVLNSCTNVSITVTIPITLIVTASNEPPNYAGSPIRITGSARYSTPDYPAQGSLATISLAGTNTTTHTIIDGTYATNVGPLAYGIYTARVCVTDGSVSGCASVAISVETPPPSGPHTIYVATNSPASGPGTGWNNAFHTIQAAVNAAASGDVVQVAAGVYRGSGGSAMGDNVIVLTNHISLLSVDGDGAAVVDGDGVRRGLYLAAPHAQVVGFTFTGGFAESVGGGIYAVAGMVENCIISNNTAQGAESSDAMGGGVYLDGGSLIHCWVVNNQAFGGHGRDGNSLPNDGPDGMPGAMEGDAGEDGFDGDDGSMHPYSEDGGNAYGGGVYQVKGLVNRCHILNNRAIGGKGGDGGSGGHGGQGGKGADGLDDFDGAPGGNGGRGGDGGHGAMGGNALGGGLLGRSSNLWNCVVIGNMVQGGAGGRGGNGGYGGSGGRGGDSFKQGGIGGSGGMGGNAGQPGFNGQAGMGHGGGVQIEYSYATAYNFLIVSNVSIGGSGLEPGSAAYGGDGGDGGQSFGFGSVGGNGGNGGDGGDAPDGGSAGLVRGGGLGAAEVTLWNFTIADNEAQYGEITTAGVAGGGGLSGFGGDGDTRGEDGEVGLTGAQKAQDGVEGIKQGENLIGMTVMLRNSIVWSETGYDMDGIDVNFIHCNTRPLQGGVGNSDEHPFFIEGYTLHPDSPCIDSGDHADWMTHAQDLSGTNRIINGVVDMGAYESPVFNTPMVSIPDAPSGPTEVITGVDAIYSTSGSTSSVPGGVEYRIDFGDGTTSDWIWDGLFDHAWSATGQYPVSAQARNSLQPELESEWSDPLMVTVADLPPPVSGNRFVSLAGSNQTPYTNWVTAAHIIQDAVDVAQSGETVWVADGIYNTGGAALPGIEVSNRVLIRQGVRVESVNGPESTIIRGAKSGPGTNAVRGVYLAYGAQIIGFTVENGSVDGEGFGPNSVFTSGGGIFAATTNNVASNCVVRNNRAFIGAGAAYVNLINCRVESNSSSYGGGAYGGTIENSHVVNNTAGMEGGGVHSASRVKQSRVSGNESGWAGGGLAQCSEVTGVIITGNRSGMGGGTFYADLVRCTVSGNSATRFGGGMHSGSAFNSIVYHNTAPVSANYVGTGLQNSHVLPAPSGNHAADPMLVSPVNGHLLPGSPCIDTAIGNSGLMTDLDHDPVPTGSAEDIGADEFSGASLTGQLSAMIKVGNPQAIAGSPVAFAVEIEGLPTGYRVDLGDGAEVSNISLFSHAYADVGTFVAILTASNASHTASASVTVEVSAADTILYVAPGGGHIPPFASWVNAATTIQHAIDIAPVGATVLVSNGVYTTGGRLFPGTSLNNLLIVTNAITVKSVNGPKETMIGGTNQLIQRGAYLGDGAVLDGFTIRNFKSRPPGGDITLELSGGGIWCESTNALIKNCIVVGNRAEAWGGGIYRGTTVDSIIISNSAGYSVVGGGGGVHEGVVIRCRVAYNVTTFSKNGGGLYNCAAYDSVIENNTAYDGGGAAHGTLHRSIVRNNTANYRGGGSLSSTLINCLVHSNTAASGGGGSKFGSIQSSTYVGNQGGGASQASVTNSILFGNSPDNYDTPNVIRNSCTTPLPDDGTNNIASDPLFYNAAVGDFRLATNSPCINAGTNLPWMNDSADLDGNPRIQEETVDIGAYEYPSYNQNQILRAWLRAQGLPDDGSADDLDFDEDGYAVMAEWVTGTNPFEPTSSFTLSHDSSSSEGYDTGPRLSWPYVSGRIYTIYWSDSPLGEGMLWNSVALDPSDFTVIDDVATWTDPNPPVLPAPRVYKLSVKVE